jgi:branched chain amino acid efflux pump
MTGAWVIVAVLFGGTVALKALGPVTFGGRALSARTAGVIGLVAPALLAALVVYEALSADGPGIALDARVAGLAVAAAVLALRRPMIVAVVAAAAVTALVRALA